MYWPFPRELNMKVVGVCVVDVNRVLVRCCWATDDFDFCKVIGHIVILDTDAKNVYEKDDVHVFEKNKNVHSKYDNHPWFNSHYDWGTYMTIQRTRKFIFIVIMDEIFIRTPKIVRGVATAPIQNLPTILYKTFVSYPKRSLVVKNRPIYLTSHETGVGEGSSNKVSGEIFVHNQS